MKILLACCPLLLAACALPTPPFGRPCDGENPCPDGYLCADDACVAEDLALDAGSPDAGSPDAGG